MQILQVLIIYLNAEFIQAELTKTENEKLDELKDFEFVPLSLLFLQNKYKFVTKTKHNEPRDNFCKSLEKKLERKHAYI